MKRIVLLLVCLLSISMVFAAFDKNESDRLFYVENDYEADFAYLSEALKSAKNNEEKAEILWRMSRTRLTLTDENKELLCFGSKITFDTLELLDDPENYSALVTDVIKHSKNTYDLFLEIKKFYKTLRREQHRSKR